MKRDRGPRLPEKYALVIERNTAKMYLREIHVTTRALSGEDQRYVVTPLRWTPKRLEALKRRLYMARIGSGGFAW